ncbi:hypothetical protein F4678DRAFT_435046 [Xylaria arbuscula]|nr:hypothetical protein F4678DRAFT_435046 [Xylaria arbuscula]
MMKSISRSKSCSRPRKRALYCPSCVCQSADDVAQLALPLQNDLFASRATIRNRTLLSIVSAFVSLSSSLFAGPLITSSAGWTMDHRIRRLWLPSGKYRTTPPRLMGLDSDAIPPIQRVTVMFHIFCLSSLVLHRTRKTDPYQTTMIILVTIVGIGLNLVLVSEESYTDTIGNLISILPCLLSLGAILSAISHTIWHSLRTHNSCMNEEVGI